jgi:hypothetical protein
MGGGRRGKERIGCRKGEGKRKEEKKERSGWEEWMGGGNRRKDWKEQDEKEEGERGRKEWRGAG